jgi:Sec-independent protein translocase protein TatA
MWVDHKPCGAIEPVLKSGMQCLVSDAEFLALFNLGGGEIVLILLLLLIMLGAKRLPDLGRWIGEGQKALDDEAHGAGKSLGGIYGKPAAEALTPDNKVAELYDPAALQDKSGNGEPVKRLAAFLWGIYWSIRKALFFWKD